MNSNEEHTIQDKIDLYLSNTMSDAERLLFEKQMEENASLKEEILLQKSIGEVLFDNELKHIKDDSKEKELAEIKKTLQKEEYQNHRGNIESSVLIYNKKKQRRKLLLVSSVAAAILAITSIFLFPAKDSFETLYAEYADWNELTSYVEQSETNQFSKGELLYKDKKYSEAIQFFEVYTKDQNNNLYAAGLMYLGASYFGEGNSEKAIDTYNLLINSNSYDSSKGYWYQLLIYLNQKNSSLVNQTLEIILSNQNNYNYKKALEIKESL